MQSSGRKCTENNATSSYYVAIVEVYVCERDNVMSNRLLNDHQTSIQTSIPCFEYVMLVQ